MYLPDMKAELPGLLCVKNRRELQVISNRDDPDPQPWMYPPDMKAELPGLLCVKNRWEL